MRRYDEVWQRLCDNIFDKQCDDETKKLIIELCFSHSEDFFNQNIHLIKDSETMDFIFMGMCMFNCSLSIIRQMVEQNKCNIYQVTVKGDTCLFLCCIFCWNLNIIKYLIEECKLDPNHTNNRGYSCFTLAYSLFSADLAIYLVESTNAKLSLGRVVNSDCRWSKIILGVKNNFERFQDLLDLGLKKINQPTLAHTIPKINPMLLISRPELFCQYNVKDPFDKDFAMKDFIKYTNDLNCCLPIPLPIPGPRPINQDNKIQEDGEGGEDEEDEEIDFISPSVPVFIYNGETYHGYPEVVFNQIILFKEIKEMARFDDLITLSSGLSQSQCLPRYLINMWLRSMYTKKINLMKIKSRSQDIVCFLDHIDRYPTLSVSIRTIEHDLIKYLDTLEQSIDTLESIDTRYLVDLSERYGLKYLYLWSRAHDQKKNKVNS